MSIPTSPTPEGYQFTAKAVEEAFINMPRLMGVLGIDGGFVKHWKVHQLGFTFRWTRNQLWHIVALESQHSVSHISQE